MLLLDPGAGRASGFDLYVASREAMRNHSKEYDQFRTGLSFIEIWEMLKIEQREGKRRHVTRHTILGKWHEIKLRMFADFEDSRYFNALHAGK